MNRFFVPLQALLFAEFAALIQLLQLSKHPQHRTPQAKFQCDAKDQRSGIVALALCDCRYAPLCLGDVSSLKGYISQACYGGKTTSSHLVGRRRETMQAIVAVLVVSIAHSLALPAACPLISDSLSFTSALANLTLPGNITSVVNTTTLRCSRHHQSVQNQA